MLIKKPYPPSKPIKKSPLPKYQLTFDEDLSNKLNEYDDAVSLKQIVDSLGDDLENIFISNVKPSKYDVDYYDNYRCADCENSVHNMYVFKRSIIEKDPQELKEELDQIENEYKKALSSYEEKLEEYNKRKKEYVEYITKELENILKESNDNI